MRVDDRDGRVPLLKGGRHGRFALLVAEGVGGRIILDGALGHRVGDLVAGRVGHGQVVDLGREARVLAGFERERLRHAVEARIRRDGHLRRLALAVAVVVVVPGLGDGELGGAEGVGDGRLGLAARVDSRAVGVAAHGAGSRVARVGAGVHRIPIHVDRGLDGAVTVSLAVLVVLREVAPLGGGGICVAALDRLRPRDVNVGPLRVVRRALQLEGGRVARDFEEAGLVRPDLLDRVGKRVERVGHLEDVAAGVVARVGADRWLFVAGGLGLGHRIGDLLPPLAGLVDGQIIPRGGSGSGGVGCDIRRALQAIRVPQAEVGGRKFDLPHLRVQGVGDSARAVAVGVVLVVPLLGRRHARLRGIVRVREGNRHASRRDGRSCRLPVGGRTARDAIRSCIARNVAFGHGVVDRRAVGHLRGQIIPSVGPPSGGLLHAVRRINGLRLQHVTRTRERLIGRKREGGRRRSRAVLVLSVLKRLGHRNRAARHRVGVGGRKAIACVPCR